jgi:replication-associated recombination protein RarA
MGTTGTRTARPQFAGRTTVHGHDTREAISAVQKSIRRNLEEDALYWAWEMYKSGYGNWVWKRLRIICSEDVGLAWPEGPAVIRALYENWMDAVGNDNSGEELFFTQAVIMLCRAPKSRIVDSAVLLFQRDVIQRDAVPDVALDKHTLRGKRLGRGIDHFFEEGTKLVPEPTLDDPYLQRAWQAVLDQPKVDAPNNPVARNAARGRSRRSEPSMDLDFGDDGD